MNPGRWILVRMRGHCQLWIQVRMCMRCQLSIVNPQVSSKVEDSHLIKPFPTLNYLIVLVANSARNESGVQRSPPKWSWSLSAVKFWSDCSQTPPHWRSWTLAAVKFWSDCSQTPPEVKFGCSEVLKWLVRPPLPRSEVEVCLQWSSEVTAVGPPPPTEVKLNFGCSEVLKWLQSDLPPQKWSWSLSAVKFWSDCSQIPTAQKWSWSLSAVKFWSDYSQIPPPKVKLKFVCSEVLKWLQSDPPTPHPTEVKLNFGCSEVLKWLQSDPPVHYMTATFEF